MNMSIERPGHFTDDTTVVPSTCWECGAICGSLLTVHDGKVLKIAPNPAHPSSRGAFCVKGIRAAHEWTYQATRLRQPLRRVGPRGSGEFTPISWDDALDEMADGIRRVRDEYGPLAIAGAVSGAAFSRGPIMARLMRALHSPNWMINQDLCGGCRAVSEKMTGLDITGGEDIENTACALIVGRNPAIADPIQWMALKRAKARGANILVIDPFRTSAAEIADLWLRPHPGTDGAIAMAMTKLLIDEGRYDPDFITQWCHGFDALKQRLMHCTPDWAAALTGVAQADIKAAARMYAAGPSCFISGHGIDAVSNGVQTFRAYHCLVAISGNIERIGGNRRRKKPTGFRTYFDVLFDPEFLLPADIEAQRIGAAEFPLWSGPLGYQMACHNPSVITAMLTGRPYPVRALYASGVNIVLTYLDSQRTIEALKTLDLFVVATQVMNPTAAWADIILPKTTSLEEEQIHVHQAAPCVTYTRAAARPDGDVRSDIDIAVGLIDRLEPHGAANRRYLPWRTQEEFNAYLIKDTDVDREALRTAGFVTFSFERANYARTPFQTPTGKVELYAENMARHGYDPLPGYVPPLYRTRDESELAAFPLILQTGLREKSYHHSRFREQAWARKVSPNPVVYIHPDTASRFNVADGDWVTVATQGVQGTCQLKSKITDDTLPGVLTTGVGWWRPDAPAPMLGADQVNINNALSSSLVFDQASGSADTRGVPCCILSVSTAGA